MEMLAEVVVPPPFLVATIPPLVDVVVAGFALLAEIFGALGGLVTVPAVLGDGFVQLGFRFFGFVPAFRELIVSMKPRDAHEEHQNRNDSGCEDRSLAASDVSIGLRVHVFLLVFGVRMTGGHTQSAPLNALLGTR